MFFCFLEHIREIVDKFVTPPELPLSRPLLRSNTTESATLCKLLPPIREGSFDAGDVLEIETLLQSCFGESYSRVLLLHIYAPAILFSGTLHGSIDSNHANSSLVLVVNITGMNDAIRKPAFVRKYTSATVLVKSESPGQI